EIYDRAKEDGSNGIIVYGTDGSINIIAFEPTQIKSATDNAGTFDGSSPDIRYSLSPTKAEKETSQWKIYRAAYNFFDNQGIRGSLPTKVERHGEAINKWKKTGGAEGKNYEDIDKMAERFASDNEEIAHMIQTNRELDGDKMLEMALDYERNRKLGRKENSEDAALREEREAWEQSEEGKAATQEEAAEKSESAQKKLQELPTWHKGRVQKEGFFRKIVREQITDRIDLKDLGVALNLDFDDAIEVAPGRIKHGISNLKKNFLDPILEIIKNHEFDYEIVDNYLYALQAKDRNKYIRDKSERKVDDGSGHTDKWADDILAEFDKLPASKKDGLKAIAGKNIELNNLKMRLLVESGLMSQETANNLKKIYPNYVPLRGLPKDINDMMNNSSFGVAKGLLAAQDNKRAYGRKSAAEDVLMQNIALAQNAIINAERNMAIREIWDGATKNPNKKYWEQNPEINDTRFGEKHYDANASTQENVMKVYIDGKANYLKFYTEDGMRIANHIKGLDKSIAGDIIGWLGKMNRFISKVVTSYSPKFVAKNAIRDYQTASTQAYIRYGGDVAAKMLKDIPINLIKLSANKAVPNEMGKWADRFSAAGGEISLVETLSFNDKVTELLKTVEDMQRSKANPIKIIHKVIAGIEGVNSVIENNTRITLFKILVEKGMSDRKAAVAAKHISTNFNQAGSKGREFNKIFMFYNAAVQGIYGSLIGHAGINPADRRFDPAIRKRQLQADAVWIMAFGAGLYGIDYALSDDGENKRNGQLNVPDHVRKSNFVSPVKNGNYITIPMSREFAFFANLGARTARKMLHEDFTAMMFAGATIADFLDNYNPFGSDIDVANPDKSFTRNVNPAFFKPIMDIYVNEDFAGRQIHPEDSNPDSNTPDSHLVYNKRVTPWVRKMAQGLNRLTGGDEHIKGSIDFNPHNFEHLIRSYAGGMGTLILQGTAQMSDERKTLDWNQKPFADIFLKSINPAANRVEVNRTIKETSGYYKRWDIRDNGDGENDAEIAEKLLDRDYGRIKLYEALKELRADARDDFKEENIEHMTAYAKAVAATDKVMRLQKTLDETKNTELREALKKDIDATLEPLDEYLE
ncbi:MAG: hypothetical protein FWC26_01935, partial [Fibromonadales bacterium]|nr:hypothetical protein [Fibromonadales bacterium]